MARWPLTPGQMHDINEAEALLAGLHAEVVVADKACDVDALVRCIEHIGATVAIPPRAGWISLWSLRTLAIRHFCITMQDINLRDCEGTTL